MQRVPLSLVLIVLSAAAAQARAADVAADEWRQWRAAAFAQAHAWADAIEDPYRRAEALTRVARAHAEHDDPPATHRALQHALEAAAQVQEPAFRDWVLHDIALTQLRVDDVVGARDVVHRMRTERPQGAALAALSDRALRAGDLDAAAQIATTIRDPGARGLALRQIIGVHAARGALPAGYALLESIADPYQEALARGDLAAAEVKAGRMQRAQALAARAPRRHRADVYARIALERAAARDLAGASETLQSIADPLAAAVVQGRIAAAYAQTGKAEAARAELDAAAGAAMRTGASARKAHTLAQLARLAAAVHDRNSASLLREARREAERLPPGEERDDALQYIASAQVRAGEAKAALDSAMLVSDASMRALLVRDIVTLQNVSDPALARASVREFEDPLIEAAALFGVLGVQSVGPGRAMTREALDAAREAVRRTDEPLRPAALAALAAAELTIGETTRAEAAFREALAAAAALDNDEQRALAHVHVIDALNDRLIFLGRAPANPSQASN